ncbi:hypothetical protein DPMN_002018 [Dreissena polymorpha]|uniref:Uncharacterized protein n=1 Tax=Dreissena polymorpha TaxID=45954 RepID=A0A9D4MLF2_DREPO|nr:hypothetical protein DPMN_002018 [Dreissena polymorpha]
MLFENKVHKPWITKAVKVLHRKRNKLFARQKATGKSKDRHSYLQAKATSQRLERQAYWKYIENLIEEGDQEEDQKANKQKRFRNFIKSTRKDNSGVAP